MTYLAFHLYFVLPPIAALLLLGRTAGGNTRGVSRFKAIGLIIAAAFSYTILWDNYLVYRGVWSYPEGRVMFTLAYVPIEEYAFFALQPLLTGLFYFQLLHCKLLAGKESPRFKSGKLTGALLMGCVSLVGVFLLMYGGDRALYLGLILSWSGPVLAILMWMGLEKIWPERRVILASIAGATVYLCIADRIAIGAGIWNISEQYSLGVELLGLPIEEAVFFLATNWMVVQGVAMLKPANTSSFPT